MNSVLLHLLILWVVVLAVVGAIYATNRRGVKFKAPQASDIFAFIGVALGVILGLTTFFASEHYGNVKQAAQSEATTLGQVYALSGSFPVGNGVLLRRQLYCYATDVIDHEWTRDDGKVAPSVEARQDSGYSILLRVGNGHPHPDSWYSDAISAALDAGTQRQNRLLLSQPSITSPLWMLIYLGAALIVLFVFFFHLASRREFIGMLVAVVIMLSGVVAVLAGLDSATQGPFGLAPTAMESERGLMAPQVNPTGESPAAFCARVPTLAVTALPTTAG